MYKSIEPEIKAAVIARAIAGEPLSRLADEYGVAMPSIKRWLRIHQAAGTVGNDDKIIGLSDEDLDEVASIDALIHKYLEENLRTLAAQSKFFRREDWLEKQAADTAALLHGVLADKSLRLLEALTDHKRTAAVNTID